ncbi:MAG: putative DNA-binding domain-containing protein [Polyangiaceae bacterium]
MVNGSLEALQTFFVRVAMRRSALGDDAGLVADAERLVVPSPRGMSPADRLDVYREQYWLRHVPSLEEDYPTLAWAVGGPAPFRELAVDYLTAFPPRTWDLQKLGEGLPSHVANSAPWQGDLLVSDAARIDWAFMEAFDAADAPPFDAHVLSVAPEDAWPLATIAFHPSVRALTVAHPVHDLRQAVRDGSVRERPTATTTHVVVWRDAGCRLQAVAIEREAFALLSSLASGMPLGQACDAVARLYGAEAAADLGPKVSSWFQQWTASGWVSAVRFAG